MSRSFHRRAVGPVGQLVARLAWVGFHPLPVGAPRQGVGVEGVTRDNPPVGGDSDKAVFVAPVTSCHRTGGGGVAYPVLGFRLQVGPVLPGDFGGEGLGVPGALADRPLH